jgi:hypothetical protein
MHSREIEGDFIFMLTAMSESDTKKDEKHGPALLLSFY